MNKVENLPIDKKLKNHLSLLVVGLLSGIFLLLVFNRDLPYEQDQVGKAAQIILLNDESNQWKPLASENIYRNFELSNYYLITANIYQFLAGNIFSVMNGLSLFFGLLFFVATAKLMARVANVSHLLTFFIFISMPIITITFIYGNEVAIALALFVLSMLLTQISIRGGEYLALLILCLATFTRIDVILLLPFWFAWTLYYSAPKGSIRGKIKKLIKQLLLFALFCLTYWIFFLRVLPLSGYSFAYNTNYKLLLGYMTYPFNFGIVFWGGLALLRMLYKNWKEALIYLLLLLPFFFYLPNLSTPKYIISFSILFAFPLLLQWNQVKQNIRSLILITIGIWWIVSITPFGVFTLQEGAYWFLPTADGPMPTGAYFNFYKNVRDGSYQERYVAEFDGVEEIFDYFEEKNSSLPILGYLNLQFYDYELINRQLWDRQTNGQMYPWARFNFISENHNLYVMVDRSYLNLGTLQPQAQKQVRDWLALGKVQQVSSSNDLLPRLILIGEDIEAENETDLGKRILFMNDYFNNQRALPSSAFVSAYRSLCWLPNDADGVKVDQEILYQDERYYAVNQNSEGCKVYNSMMPFVYFEEEDPKGY